jgi:hypothetical protein
LRAIAVTLLISGFVACAGSAQAQAGPAGDVRCLLTMAALSGNKANQPQATFGVFYFSGRIKAQAPAFNFGTDLKPVAAKMTPADYQAEVKRCGPMVAAVIEGMQAAQAALGGQSAPGQAAPARPPAAPVPPKK